MKYLHYALLLILLPFIEGCGVSDSDNGLSCDDPIKAEYQRLISYNGFQAHEFKADNMLYLKSPESFVEGESYLLCVDGDTIVDYAK